MATSPTATARGARTSPRPPRRRRRADRLPRWARRGGVEAPREPPRDRAEHLLSTRRPGHLLPRRRGDRRGQRVVPHPLLPGQAPAGDGHPEVDPQPDPADRDRRRDRVPAPARRHQGGRGARDRHRRPRRHDLRRDDGRDGRGDGERRAAAGPRAGADPGLSSHWIGLVTPVDTGVARPLVQGLSVETIVKDPSGMELFDLEPTPLDEAMRAAIEEGER